MEPLLNPDRPRYRWWTEHWPLIWQLEQHAMPLDPHLRRLSLQLVDRHPGLRRYVERLGVPAWDIIGWESEGEGPWRQRRLVALFLRPPWEAEPKMLCLDGPPTSLHRNGELELCLYYERDPDERRWKVSDGLVRLFDLARVHLYSEHIWRERGMKDTDWPTPQAAHGYGAPAPPDPSLLLPPELPLTADGRPTGALFI
jgi:hypothetical protein